MRRIGLAVVFALSLLLALLVNEVQLSPRVGLLMPVSRADVEISRPILTPDLALLPMDDRLERP